MYPSQQTPIERMRARNEQTANKTDADQKHDEMLYTTGLQNQALLQAVRSLATIAPQITKFLENHTSKTEVVNQLDKISTPDALKVIPEIEALHNTLKNRPTTDLSEVARLLESVLKQAEQIPKEHQTIEIPTEISVKNQADYSKDFKSLEQAVKAIKTQVDVKAPIVNVKAPQVTVDAPDLKPLTTEITKSFDKSIGGIKYPDIPKVELDTLEKEAKKHSRLLDELLKKPTGGGNSGLLDTPYQSDVDTPAYVLLQNGAVPTTDQAYAVQIDEAAPITYIGKALPGTLISEAGWQIKKIDETSGTSITWASGSANFNQVWTSRAGLTYS